MPLSSVLIPETVQMPIRLTQLHSPCAKYVHPPQEFHAAATHQYMPADDRDFHSHTVDHPQN